VDKVVADDGIDVVQSAMQRHVNSSLVQSRGCELLRRVLRGRGLEDPNTAVIVVSGMRRHGACVDVQAHGCAVLCSLASHGGCCVAIGDAGGVDVVTAAMARHADSAAVQRHGCDVLRLLALNRRNRQAIVDADGVSLVVSAMRRHEEVSLAHNWVRPDASGDSDDSDDSDAEPSEELGTYVEVGQAALDNIAESRAISDVPVPMSSPRLLLNPMCTDSVPSPLCTVALYRRSVPSLCVITVALYRRSVCLQAHFAHPSSLRRLWLEACDAFGRDAAVVAVGTDDRAPSALSVCAALADRVRVSVVGDLSTRPRVCASVYGGIVARFLNVFRPPRRWWGYP
jgi:hypothetical protein